MEPGFWKEKWRNEQIGFHQKQINRRLLTYFPSLGIPSGAPVFVPLCGKSRDMLRLRSLGHPVIGVELSRLAARDFFAEAGLEPTVTEEPPFQRWSADGIDILCGDFFDLSSGHLAGVAAWYDRAALVALPPAMRADYAAHLAAVLPRNVAGLLLTFEYDQNEMEGPPFAVWEEEVRRIFGDNFDVEAVVHEEDILEFARFRERLTALSESVYILRRGVSGQSE